MVLIVEQIRFDFHHEKANATLADILLNLHTVMPWMHKPNLFKSSHVPVQLRN